MKSFAVAALASSAFALPRLTIPNYPFNPVGYGPLPSVDTPEAFQALEAFSKAARSVATPSGYVRSYVDLNHTYDEPTMFVKYIELEDYDVDTCAAACNNAADCNAFSIFFERSPLIDPVDAIPNPPSTTRIKCDLWSGTITEDIARNFGQFQKEFHVVMAGSNAYVKEIYIDGVPQIPGWSTDVYKNGSTIHAPLDCNGHDTYLGMQRISDGKFDPVRCVNICSATPGCRFVTTYLQRWDGVPASQHCALYTAHWPKWYATNEGQPRGKHDISIDAESSFGFTKGNGTYYQACEPPRTNPTL